MDNIPALLDKIKQTRSLASDKALADLLKASPAALSNWKHGTRLPDPVACARIAEVSGLKLAHVLGIVGEARAISREEKAVWRRLATAAVLIISAIGGIARPGDVSAASGNLPSYTLCAQNHLGQHAPENTGNGPASPL